MASAAPLVTNGMVSPADVDRTIATFAADSNDPTAPSVTDRSRTATTAATTGSSSRAVVFSKLQPSLATMFVMDDGAVNVKTWGRADDALLPHIRTQDRMACRSSNTIRHTIWACRANGSTFGELAIGPGRPTKT